MASDGTRFRGDIEGLRGLAILLVVAYHAGARALSGGYVGVDVFFVLSGFLITGLLTRELAETGDLDLAEFYRRRMLRLLPAFLVVLLSTIGLTLWLYAPIDQPGVVSGARAVALHAGNVLFARTAVDYHASSGNPLLHTWSLAVEEQFYVVWPLLLLLAAQLGGNSTRMQRRLVGGVIVAGVVSFLLSLVVTKVAQPWAFFGMPTRIWEFAAGGLAALAMSNGVSRSLRSGTALQLVGLTAIAAAAVLYTRVTPYPGLAAVLPVAGTVALLVGGQRAPHGVGTAIMGASPLRWFGRVSYAWYLWHWPIVGVGSAIDWRIGVAGKLAWSGVALVLAVLTLRFVEEPARRSTFLSTRPRWSGWVALGASAGVLVIAAAGVRVANRAATAPEQQRFAAARNDGMEHDCWGSLLENAAGPCEFGDRRSRTTVVLLGDSHAEHWLPAVDRLGRERHWKVIAMVKPACPVADDPTLVNWRLKRQYTECASWRRVMLARIVALRPALTILSSWDHYMPTDGGPNESGVTPASWRDGLRRTYATLSRAGLETVVIRGTPRPGFDVPACLSRMASQVPLRVAPCEYDRTGSLSPVAIRAQSEAARGLPHISFVDLNDRVCATPICPVIRGGTIVFQDDGHLTAAFSVAAAPVLGERIDRALSR